MSIPVFCALLLTFLAAYTDLHEQRIPNLLTVGGWIAGAGMWMGFRGFRGLPVWFAGCVCLGAAGILVWRLGGIGAGDVKLLSALGGILSWKRGLWVFFAAGVLTVCWWMLELWRKREINSFIPRMRMTLAGLFRGEAEGAKDKKTKIRFAVMLLLAVGVRAAREWWWLH